MKIGIIGAGQIGSTLTRRLTALGHQVSVANSRGPETLADLAAETGANPVWVAEAARSEGVVIVTIPHHSESPKVSNPCLWSSARSTIRPSSTRWWRTS